MVGQAKTLTQISMAVERVTAIPIIKLAAPAGYSQIFLAALWSSSHAYTLVTLDL